MSKLTNEVHKLLFSGSVISSFKNNPASLDFGILSEEDLTKILPSFISCDHLVHLQYCYRIKHSDVHMFSSLEQENSDKSFFFFPALCSVDKSEVSWKEASDNNFSIGWVAQCSDVYDYFPPRFLHVLLLRLVFSFALPVPSQLQSSGASSEYTRRCTMWNKGVHWLMAEGVDCLVEVVSINRVDKVVVVLTKSPKEFEEECVTIFFKIIHCVLQAKSEFCHSLKPHFFLLDSTAEEDYLNQDKLFAMSDVEAVIANPTKNNVIISINGKGNLKCSKLLRMRKLITWNDFFPIDLKKILHFLEEVVHELYELGVRLGAPQHVLEGLETDYPKDVNQRRRELVKWWINSSSDPPCWWLLVQALCDIDRRILAEEIQEEHGPHVSLQENLLDPANQAQKPDDKFLKLFSLEVGSKWLSLAVSLALTEEDIAGLKEKAESSHEELALDMLKIWASKEEATCGQLCDKLKTIPFINLHH